MQLIISKVAEIIGYTHKFSFPFYLQGNFRITNVHNFLKNCIQKHITGNLPWDMLLPLGKAIFNQSTSIIS